MKASDFIYNDKKLSEFGFMICSFDSKGLETIEGTEISFNSVPTLNGTKSELVSVVYEQNLETTIQICKNICSGGALEIQPHEYRNLTKWLGKKGFYKLKFFDESHIDIYYEAAFTSISRIEVDGKLIGLELNIVTNRPFALKEPKTIVIKNNVVDGKYSINDTSYEEGHIYPYVEITIEEDGHLKIYNSIESRETYIANCVAGEVITMDYPIIQSSKISHNIQNDFNWNFFRIANTYEKSRNDLTISLPCTIKIKYSPIVKVGL